MALVLLVGLAIQNSTPIISLVFLGVRLQPLPLGVLVVLAFACGSVTGLAIFTLLRFNRFLLRRKWTALQNKDSFRQPLPPPPDPIEPSRKDPSQKDPSQKDQPKKSPWSWGKFTPEPEPEQAPWDDWEEDPGAQKTVYDAEFRVVRPPVTPDGDGEFDHDSAPQRRH
jgi:uncharacterized integral membrane protein